MTALSGRVPTPPERTWSSVSTTGMAAARIVAPSKLPRPSGERVRTGKCDARFPAGVGAMGECAVVGVPQVDEEAAREVVWARGGIGGVTVRAGSRRPRYCAACAQIRGVTGLIAL